jgi:hypothetical protein
VRSLLAETGNFEQSGAFIFETEVEAISSKELTFRCFALQRKALPPDWSLRVGEAIQNLRSSLDHLVYAASQGPRAQFPIFTDPDGFAQRGATMLAGVPENMVRRIEAAQPYRVAPESPDHDLLELLRRWSNIDKHRVLTAVVSAVLHEAIGVNEGVEIDWEEPATGRILEGERTQISRFTARAQRPIEPADVQPQFDYHVAVEGRQFATLRGVVHRVFKVLHECESDEDLSPFAAYPL